MHVLRPTRSRSAPARTGAVVLVAAACASVVVSHTFGRLTYPLVFPAIEEDLLSSYSQAGTIGLAYFAGYMLGVMAVTLLSARVRPTSLMTGGLAMAAVALAAMATAPNFVVFAVATFMAGLAGAGIWVPAPGVAGARVSEDRRGLAIGALTAAMGLAFLGVAATTAIQRRATGDDTVWRPVFAGEAVVTVVILVFVVVVFRRSGMSGPNAEPIAAPGAPSEDAGSDLKQLAARAWEALRSIPGWRYLTVSYAMFGAIAGAWAQFFSLALDDAGWSSGAITWLYTAMAAVGIVGPLLIGALSDRLGRDRAIAVAAVLVAVGSVMVAVGGFWWYIAAGVLFGGASYGVPPVTAAAVSDRLDRGRFGMAFGLMTVLYAATSLVASQLAGLSVDMTGSFDPVYLGLGAMSAIAALAALARFRQQKLRGQTPHLLSE